MARGESGQVLDQYLRLLQIERVKALREPDVNAGEKIVFSWMTWPDKDTAHRCYAKMREDDAMTGDTPFDPKRMIWGGFAPLFTMGRE